MGYFEKYISRTWNPEQLREERKKLLQTISEIRGNSDVLVYAADINSTRAPSTLVYDDLHSFYDLLSDMEGDRVDLILETPGGSGEVAEDIVRTLRSKYEHMSVIVPGWAKSAGTIITMASDEILMDSTSALGPIDAQLFWQGKIFSADALIKGFEKIKEETDNTGKLNPAYIPILQGISPGELESAQNSLDFAKDIVTEWLATYKFKHWNKHSKTGEQVTEEEKWKRAEEIATELCNHEKWKSHGKSIRIDDLERMRLKINNYEHDYNLYDAIKRYQSLVKITFESNTYKIFESEYSQIFKSFNDSNDQIVKQKHVSEFITINLNCPNCKNKLHVQFNFLRNIPIQPGSLKLNPNGTIKCPNCSSHIDLKPQIKQVETQFGRNVIL